MRRCNYPEDKLEFGRGSNTTEVAILVALLLCMVLSLSGCATIQPVSPADQKRFEDEFRRMHENPFPPGLVIPPTRR